MERKGERMGGYGVYTILFKFPTSSPSKISRASSLWPTSSKASVASCPPTSRRTSSPPLLMRETGRQFIGSEAGKMLGGVRLSVCMERQRSSGFEEGSEMCGFEIMIHSMRGNTYGCSSTKLVALYTLS